MKRSWSDSRAEADSRQMTLHRRFERDVVTRERIDPVFVGLVLLLVGASLAVGAAIGLWSDVDGWLDSPVFAPLRDERILTNLRDSKASFVDAEVVDDSLVILRSDDSLHRFNPTTGMWTDDSIGVVDGIEGNIDILAGGCPFEGSLREGCDDAIELFAVTDSGGLAIKRRGVPWTSTVSDVAWVGIDGVAVEQAMVETWAASDDGRWIAAYAANGGVGLFDQRRGAWVSVAPGAQQALVQPATSVMGIRYAYGSFWIGARSSQSSGGLFRLQPSPTSPSLTSVQGLSGAVESLEATASGTLLVVVSAPCANDRELSCTRLVDVDGRGDVRHLVGGSERFAELGTTSIGYAVAQGERLVVFGEAGVYVYEQAMRSWDQLTLDAVTAHHVTSDGANAYVATGQRVLQIRGGQILSDWTVRGPDIRQLFLGPGGEVLALRESGDVVAVSSGTTVVFVDPPVSNATRYVATASIGSTVIMVGPDGAVVFDVEARRRTSIPASALPELLRRRSVRLHSTPRGNATWAVDISTGIISTVGRQGNHPTVRLSVAEIGRVPGPVRSVTSDASGLHVVDANGVPHGVGASTSSDLVTEIGSRFSSRSTIVDADAAGSELIVATTDDIWKYDPATRAWTSHLPGVPGQTIVDVSTGGVFGDEGLVIATGREIAFARDAGSWQAMVGTGTAAPFGHEALSDAMELGQVTWFGGGGQVFAYDATNRAIVQTYSGGRGEVRFLGAVDDDPVWLSGSAVRVGGRVASEGAVADAWRAPDGYVTSIVGPTGTYVRVFDDRFRSVECHFLSITAPPVDAVDARSLGSGRLFVITPDGDAVYEPAFRRWLDVTGPTWPVDTRLYRIDRYLVAVTSQSVRFADVTAINVPNSCTLEPVSIPWSQPLSVRATSVDESEGKVVMLREDGSVDTWVRGVVSEVLPAPTTGPDPSTLRRVGRSDSIVWMAATDALWYYDTRTRRWSSTGFLPRRDWDEVDVVQIGQDRYAVTLWADGTAFGAEISRRDTSASFSSMVQSETPAFSESPDDLVDVSSDGSTWTFLFESASLDWDERTSRFVRAWTLPSATRDRSWTTLAGRRTLVEGRLEDPSRLWIIVGDASGGSSLAEPIERDAYVYEPGSDRSYAVESGVDRLWRVDVEGVLWSCDMRPGSSTTNGCSVRSSAPLAVSPSSFVAAHQVGGGYVLISSSSVLRLDAARRSMETLTDLEVANDSRWFRFRGSVYYWEGPGARLWLVGETGDPQLVAERVLHVASRSELLVVMLDTGPVSVVGADVKRPGEDVFDLEGLRATTLDLDEGFVGFDTVNQAPVRLATGEAFPVGVAHEWPTDLETLILGTTRLTQDRVVAGWWTQDALGRVNFLYVDECIVEPEPDLSETEGTEEDPDEVRSTTADGEDAIVLDESTPDLQLDDVPDVVPQDLSSPIDETVDGSAPIEPESEPCSRRLLSSDIEIPERVLDVVQAGDSNVVVTARSSYVVSEQRLVERLANDVHPWGEPTPLERVDGALRAGIVVVDGAFEMFPSTIVATTSGIEVFNGRSLTRSAGARRPIAASPLASGFIDWVRAEGGFRFSSSSGTLPVLAPSEAIVDGRFLMSHPGRSAFLGGGRFAFLNRFGLWSVDDTGRPVLQRLEPYSEVLGLAKGQFLLDVGQVDAVTGDLLPDRRTTNAVEGDLVFTETLRGGGIDALATVSGSPRSPFASLGFSFDVRRGIALTDDGRSVLLTDLGIVPTDTLQDFGLGPEPDATLSEIAFDEGQLFGRVGADRWYVRDDSGWGQAAPPHQEWDIATIGDLVWSRTRRGLQISSTVGPWRIARTGLAFETDRFIGVASTDATVVLVTGVGTVATNQARRLAFGVAPDDAARVPTSVDAGSSSPGLEVVWGNVGGAIRVWDERSSTWVSPSPSNQPWLARTAVSGTKYRVAFAAGVPLVDVSIVAVDGRRRWARFEWREGDRFPFDRVTSVEVTRVNGVRHVLVGTLFGVHLFTHENDWSYRGLLDVSKAVDDDEAEGVISLGRPLQRPGSVAIDAESGCSRFEGADRIVAGCPTTSYSKSYLILDDPFWTWTRSAGVIDGTYKLFGGASVEVSLPEGGIFPHDDLQAVTYCNGARFEVWSSSRVVARRTSQAVQLIDTTSFAPVDSYCHESTSELSGARLQPGVYLLGRSEVRMWTGNDFGQVEGPVALAARSRKSGEVAFDASRYRVRLAGGQLVEDLRSLNDEWIAIGSRGGVSDLDVTLSVVFVQRSPYRLTPAGFVPMSVSTGRAWRMDPETLLVRTGDAWSRSSCAVSIVEVMDGSFHAVASEAGSPVRWQCSNGQRFVADLSTSRDDGAIEPLASDPFSSRVVVDDPATWTWTRSLETSGRSSVHFVYKGEQGQLSAGRFSFDEIVHVAVPFAASIELVSSDGWWSYPSANVHVTSGYRSTSIQQPRNVQGAYSSPGTSRGVDALCLEFEGDERLWLDADGSKRSEQTACTVATGHDGFWQFTDSPGGAVRAQGEGVGGVVGTRSLVGGRFDDLVVTGVPVVGTFGGDVGLAIPTRSGVTVLALDDGAPIDRVFNDRSKGTVLIGTNVYDVSGDGSLMNVQTGAVEPLCWELTQWVASTIDGVDIAKGAYSKEGALSLWTTEAGEREQVTLVCGGDSDRSWLVRTDVVPRLRHRVDGSAVDTDPDDLTVCLVGSDVVGQDVLGRSTVLGAYLGRPLTLHAVNEESIVLTTDADVYALNADVVMRALAREPSPRWLCGR